MSGRRGVVWRRLDGGWPLRSSEHRGYGRERGERWGGASRAAQTCSTDIVHRIVRAVVEIELVPLRGGEGGVGDILQRHRRGAAV